MRTTVKIFVLAFAVVNLLAIAAYAEDNGAKTSMPGAGYGVPGTDRYSDPTVYLGALEPTESKPATNEKAVTAARATESYEVQGSDVYADDTVYAEAPAGSTAAESKILTAPNGAAFNPTNAYGVPGDDAYGDSGAEYGAYEKSPK